MKSFTQSPRFWMVLLITAGASAVGGYYFGRSGEAQQSSAGTRNAVPAAPVLPASGAVRTSADAGKDDVLRGVVPGVPNTALRAQMKDALYNPDEFARLGRFQFLLEMMRPEDAPEMEKIFAEADKDGRTYPREFSAFWIRWGVIDGAAAMKRLQSDTRHYEHHYAEVGRGWARTAPDAARKWLEDHKDDANKWASIREGMWNGSIERDPAAAVETVLKSMPAEEQPARMGQLARMLVNTRGLETAVAWFNEQSARKDVPPEILKEAFNAVADGVTRAGPQRLAEFIESRPDSAELRDKVQRLVDKWTGANPTLRLDYIAGLPPEYYDDASVSKALDRLSADPDNLGLWLKNHPAARFYDDAALRYSQSLLTTDAEAAKVWAETIKDPAKRSRALNPER